MACSFMDSVQLYMWTARSEVGVLVAAHGDEALDERHLLLISGQGEGKPPKLVGVNFIQRLVGEGTVTGPRIGNGHFRE